MASRSWARVAAAYLGLVVVMAAIGALAGGTDDGGDPIEALERPKPRAAFPLETRSPQVVGGSNLRVLVALRRPALGDLRPASRPDPAAQRAYVRSLNREVRALQSALEARGVTFGDPVTYARVWSGFAATVSTRDMTAVQAAGLRVEPVRRFYPAAVNAGEPVARTTPPAAQGLRLRDDPLVAVLDSAIDASHPALRGRLEEPVDVIGPARTPAGRREEHGTQVAGVLAAALPPRGRLLPIRVAALQPRPEGGGFEESGTTDQLLAGMERAVDPDGDGDAEDAAPVALVGVTSPYAGFDSAPEGEATRAAAALGTLTVAPAGNQGPGGGPYGTIGSPAAAPAALAVGALAGPQPVRPVTLTIASAAGSTAVAGELLGGAARAIEGTVTARRARARRAIFVAGGDPAAAVETAVAARAAALVVCRAEGSLPALPRSATGTLPVIGLTGDAARQTLATARAGEGVGEIAVGRPPRPIGRLRPAPSSSTGPTYSLAPKPDLFAPGSALAAVAGGGEAYAAGTSIAAARVAADAALLRAARPRLDADEAAALLTETGARAPSARRAAAARLVALPRSLRLAPRVGGIMTLRNLGTAPQRVVLRARGLRAPVAVRIGPRAARRIRVRPVGRRGPRTLAIRAGRTRLTVAATMPGRPPRARLGALELVRKRRGVEGVRFVAGRVGRSRGRPAVEPVGALVLRLTGPERRELTPPGGARDLLPGEYAYTLTREVLEGLPPGSYRFSVSARGPAGGPVVGRRSRPFRLP